MYRGRVMTHAKFVLTLHSIQRPIIYIFYNITARLSQSSQIYLIPACRSPARWFLQMIHLR